MILIYILVKYYTKLDKYNFIIVVQTHLKTPEYNIHNYL